MDTGTMRWLVNVVSFVLLLLLAVTGLVNWLLPHGGGPASAVYAVRQFLRGVHQLGALLFLLAIGLHLWMHWNYIRQNLKKMGLRIG